MNTTLKTLTAAAALLATIGSAHAEMHYSKSGVWDIGMGTSYGGNPMCSIGVGDYSRSKSVWLKSEAKANGAGVFGLQFAKQGWQVPDGQQVDIVLQVDNAPGMLLHGYGMQIVGETGWGGFWVPIGINDIWQTTGKPMITELTSLLGEGREVKVTFVSGSEIPWVAPLTGSSQALATMQQCMFTIAQLQPKTAPSQPFSAPVATTPTQPFGRSL